MSKEEIRKLLPMEFYAKEDMEIYTEISLVTLNEIMKYISNKEQIIDKAIEFIKENFTNEDMRTIYKILGGDLDGM